MSIGDKALRNKAVPFLAEPIVTGGVFFTTDYDGIDLLRSPTSTSRLTKTIPLARPVKGDIVEAYLFMRMIAPSNKPLNVRIGIGTMTSHTPTIAYTEAEVADKHFKITATSAPFNVAANGTLVVEANLLSQLPRRGDSNFYQEAFALIVTFDSLPDTANGYSLSKFFVSCSAQMGANV